MNIHKYYVADIFFILFVNTCIYGERMKFLSLKGVKWLNINLRHYMKICKYYPAWTK